MHSICVIGYPSKLGGADTELDHQIRCWQLLGLQVHLLHTGPIDANLQAMQMGERGCVVHEPRDWAACRGMHVISYCNGEFLKHLHIIKKYARSIENSVIPISVKRSAEVPGCHAHTAQRSEHVSSDHQFVECCVGLSCVKESS